MKLTRLIFGVSLLAGSLVGAENKYLRVGKIPSITLSPGQTTEVSVSIQIDKEFHVQAHSAPKPYIETTLSFEEKTGLTPGSPVYPPGKPYRLQGAQTDISVYGGKIQI